MSGHSAHGLGVSLIQWRAILGWVLRIAFHQRVDVSLLVAADLVAQGNRLLQCIPGLGRGLLVHRHVDVGAPGVGHAPPRHRAIGIDQGRCLERANRLGVIEAVKQDESLVEVALRQLRFRRDGMMMAAQIVEERRNPANGIVVPSGGQRTTRQQSGREGRQAQPCPNRSLHAEESFR